MTANRWSREMEILGFPSEQGCLARPLCHAVQAGLGQSQFPKGDPASNSGDVWWVSSWVKSVEQHFLWEFP